MRPLLILADWNGGLIPMMVGGPLLILGLIVMLIGAATKVEEDASSRKVLFRIGTGFLIAAFLTIILGKKFGP